MRYAQQPPHAASGPSSPPPQAPRHARLLGLLALVLATATTLPAQEWEGTISGTENAIWVPDISRPVRALYTVGEQVKSSYNDYSLRQFLARWNIALTITDTNGAYQAANEIPIIEAKLEGLATTLGKPECRYLPLIARGFSASSAQANDILRNWEAAHPGRSLFSVQYKELDRWEQTAAVEKQFLPAPGTPHLVIAGNQDSVEGPGEIAYAALHCATDLKRPLTYTLARKGHSNDGNEAFVYYWMQRILEDRLPAVPATDEASFVPIPSYNDDDGYRGRFNLTLTPTSTWGWQDIDPPPVSEEGFIFFPHLDVSSELPGRVRNSAEPAEGVKLKTGSLVLGDPAIGPDLTDPLGTIWLHTEDIAKAWLSQAGTGSIAPALEPIASVPATTTGLRQHYFGTGGKYSWNSVFTSTPQQTTVVKAIDINGLPAGAYLWEGYITVPADGPYAFSNTNSAWNANFVMNIKIDGAIALDGAYDGSYGSVFYLKAGTHAFACRTNVGSTNNGITFDDSVLMWKPADSDQVNRETIPASVWSHPTGQNFNINTAPIVRTLGDITLTKPVVVLTRPIFVDDRETDAADLTVSVTSSNQSVIANNQISVEETKALNTTEPSNYIDEQKLLVLTPAANASGSTTLTISVSDGVNTTTQTLQVTLGSGGPAITAPTITTEPASQTVTEGDNVTFTVAANANNGTLSYQWKRGTTNVGTNSATLSLSNVTTANAGSYTVVVTNEADSVTSTAATLTVNPAVTAPTITTQPASQTVTEGDNVTFTVAANANGGTLSYQWKRGTTNVGTNSATLSLSNVTTANAGSYTVVVTNSAGSKTSTAATLTVNASTGGGTGGGGGTPGTGDLSDYILHDLVDLTFDVDAAGYYQARTGIGYMRPLIEPNNWERIRSSDKGSGLFTENVATRQLNYKGDGVTKNTPTRFGTDGNNDGDGNDVIGNNSLRVYRPDETLGAGLPSNAFLLSKDQDWATSGLNLRIQNTSGVTLTQWYVGVNVFYAEPDETNLSVLQLSSAVSNGSDVSQMSFTAFGAPPAIVTGQTIGATPTAVLNEIITTAPVAPGDYLVIAFEDLNGPQGSTIFLDDIIVTGLEPAGPVVLSAVADRSSQGSDTSGTASTESVSKYARYAVKFNLPATGPAQAVLSLYRGPSTRSAAFSVYAIGDGWDESTNPANSSTLIASAPATEGSVWLDFDVTSYVQAQAGSDQVASFLVKTDNGGWVSVHARENPVNPPELILSGTAP